MTKPGRPLDSAEAGGANGVGVNVAKSLYVHTGSVAP